MSFKSKFNVYIHRKPLKFDFVDLKSIKTESILQLDSFLSVSFFLATLVGTSLFLTNFCLFCTIMQCFKNEHKGSWYILMKAAFKLKL